MGKEPQSLLLALFYRFFAAKIGGLVIKKEVYIKKCMPIFKKQKIKFHQKNDRVVLD
jgi:hypothetical protein